MISVIYAKVGSDSFTQVIQQEFDDVKIPMTIVDDDDPDNEKIIYETPSWWREPKEVVIPDGCIVMSEARPDTNYIASDNGDGTGKWIKSPLSVPTSLSRFQAITILKLTKLEDGQTLYQATEDYINSLSDDTIDNITAKTAWENAQAFKRDSALIKMAQTMFQLTDEQVDQMFINGAKIEA